jgi:hypothetical protein
MATAVENAASPVTVLLSSSPSLDNDDEAAKSYVDCSHWCKSTEHNRPTWDALGIYDTIDYVNSKDAHLHAFLTSARGPLTFDAGQVFCSPKPAAQDLEATRLAIAVHTALGEGPLLDGKFTQPVLKAELRRIRAAYKQKRPLVPTTLQMAQAAFQLSRESPNAALIVSDGKPTRFNYFVLMETCLKTLCAQQEATKAPDVEHFGEAGQLICDAAAALAEARAQANRMMSQAEKIFEVHEDGRRKGLARETERVLYAPRSGCSPHSSDLTSRLATLADMMWRDNLNSLPHQRVLFCYKTILLFWDVYAALSFHIPYVISGVGTLDAPAFRSDPTQRAKVPADVLAYARQCGDQASEELNQLTGCNGFAGVLETAERERVLAEHFRGGQWRPLGSPIRLPIDRLVEALKATKRLNVFREPAFTNVAQVYQFAVGFTRCQEQKNSRRRAELDEVARLTALDHVGQLKLDAASFFGPCMYNIAECYGNPATPCSTGQGQLDPDYPAYVSMESCNREPARGYLVCSDHYETSQEPTGRHDPDILAENRAMKKRFRRDQFWLAYFCAWSDPTCRAELAPLRVQPEPEAVFARLRYPAPEIQDSKKDVVKGHSWFDDNVAHCEWVLLNQEEDKHNLTPLMLDGECCALTDEEKSLGFISVPLVGDRCKSETYDDVFMLCETHAAQAKRQAEVRAKHKVDPSVDLKRGYGKKTREEKALCQTISDRVAGHFTRLRQALEERDKEFAVAAVSLMCDSAEEASSDSSSDSNTDGETDQQRRGAKRNSPSAEPQAKRQSPESPPESVPSCCSPMTDSQQKAAAVPDSPVPYGPDF